MSVRKLVFCAVTLIMFCGFGWSVLYVRHFVNIAMEGPGRVAGLVEDTSKYGFVYKPFVEFDTVDGRHVQFTSSYASNPPSYDVGENVSVYYDPKNPQSAMINDWFSLWGAPAGLALLTAGFGFFTYMMYFRVSFKTPRKRRKSARSSGSGSR